MSREKTEEVVSPRELQQNSKGTIAQARKKALKLVDKALESHIIGFAEHQNLVTAVGKAIQVEDSDILKLRKRRVHSSVDVPANKDGSSSGRRGGRSSSIDDHNEICEVCDKGGDLLCCDTCTLVFHLKCIRPKLTAVPKGHWSCPHCIIDDLAGGDVCEAKRAIRSMRRLGRGIDSDDESSFTGAAPTEGPEAMRLNDVGSYSIVRKGKKFVLRRMERKQMVDVGKYLSLEEALNYIKEERYHQQKQAEEGQREMASEKGKSGHRGADSKEASRSKTQTTHPFSGSDVIPPSSSTTSLSSLNNNNRRSTRHGGARERDDDPAGSTTTAAAVTARDNAGSEKDDGAQTGADASSSSSESYDELWCTHCLDDREVTVCAFCGCKKCFGKYDSSLLILCDHCDRETHTYCLDPPLSAVPDTDPWYCQSCTADGLPSAARSEDGEDGAADGPSGPGAGGVSSEPEDDQDAWNLRKRRRGRPPSSTVSVLPGEPGASRGEAREIVTYKKCGRGYKKIRTIVYGDAGAAAALAAATEDAKKGVRGKTLPTAVSSASLASHASATHSATAAANAAAVAAAANAALAAHQTPFPVQRGRGRPPGSGKRPAPVPSAVFAAAVATGGGIPDLPPPPPLPPALARSGSKFSSQGSLMEAYSARPTPGKDKLAPLLKSGSRTWSFGGADVERPDGSRRSSSLSLGQENTQGVSPRSRPSFGNSSEGGAMQVEDPAGPASSAIISGNPHTLTGEGAAQGADDAMEVAAEDEFVPGAVGLPSALAVIERASLVNGKVDGGPWAEGEMDLLEQLRHWGPVQDLQKAHEALLAQKDLLVKRIMAMDSLFDARDFEDAVQTEIAAAAWAASSAVSTATLGASGGAGGTVAGGDTAGATGGSASSSVTGATLVGSTKKRASKSSKPAKTGLKGSTGVGDSLQNHLP